MNYGFYFFPTKPTFTIQTSDFKGLLQISKQKNNNPDELNII